MCGCILLRIIICRYSRFILVAIDTCVHCACLACYGIVTVPVGSWYCRKCESQERAARVVCITLWRYFLVFLLLDLTLETNLIYGKT